MKKIPKYELLIMLYKLKEKEHIKIGKSKHKIKAYQELIDQLVNQIEPLEFLRYRIDRGV